LQNEYTVEPRYNVIKGWQKKNYVKLRFTLSKFDCIISHKIYVIKEPERQTVDLKTQIYWMLKDMASKISSEIRISNEEQFLESIKLEYSAVYFSIK
jgi:hypothetical protein